MQASETCMLRVRREASGSMNCLAFVSGSCTAPDRDFFFFFHPHLPTFDPTPAHQR
jgi:hypothetical protein